MDRTQVNFRLDKEMAEKLDKRRGADGGTGENSNQVGGF